LLRVQPRAGPILDGAEIAIFDHSYDALKIKTPRWRQAVGNLSGGNQKQIVIFLGACK